MSEDAITKAVSNSDTKGDCPKKGVSSKVNNDNMVFSKGICGKDSYDKELLRNIELWFKYNFD